MKRTISGIRGVIGDDLGMRDVIGFCSSFAVLAGTDCVLARDTRPSGTMLCGAAAAALMQHGVNVHDLGVAATPVAFRESRRRGAGVIVTASHNPVPWNGLKFVLAGRGINGQELASVLEPAGEPAGPAGSYGAASSSYVEDAAELLGRSADGADVVVDAGGGAAAGVAPALLGRLGCRVRTINGTPGDASRGPDPTADGLGDLAAASKTADVGLAFDLDGDRLVVVSGGRKMPPDFTLGLGIAGALEMGYRRFVLSIDTSVAIERLVRQAGGTVDRSRVGETNVVGMMLKTGAQAGGEGSSGGFILPEFNYCRDGILTAGIVASMVNRPVFGEVAELVGRYHQMREKVAVPPGEQGGVLKRVAEIVAGEYDEVMADDGIRGVADENSWILVRASNTENVIRISAESDSPEKARRMARRAAEAVVQCRGL